MNPTPQWNDSVVDDVEATANSTPLEQGKHYRIAATVDLWWKVQTTGDTAPDAADNGTHFLKSGADALVYAQRSGTSVFYVRQGASDGKVSISEVEV
jgi:hypothetical protein